MLHRTHQKYHIKTMTSLHSLSARFYFLTPSSFLRRCWSTNSHGFGVDQSQWKLQTNSGSCCVWCEHNNNLKGPLSHTSCLCVRLCMCLRLHGRESEKKRERSEKGIVCVIARPKALQRHYRMRFMRVFTVPLAIKQRSLLLSKVHTRSGVGGRERERSNIG